MSLPEKYDRLAERWSEHAYGDPQGYLRHRAELTLALGPPVAAGDTVLDLGCADAGVAEYLVPHGLRYRGVDFSPAMVESARLRFGGQIDVQVGDLESYEPPEAVVVTTCFRAIYYATDQAAFFRRVAGYTTGKFVFDFSPRRIPLERVRADLRAAGFDRLECRPFLVPQSRALPGRLAALLRLLERSGAPGRLLVRFRFSLICAAYRSAQEPAGSNRNET
jgi:SAM-dependent methyltransferase